MRQPDQRADRCRCNWRCLRFRQLYHPSLSWSDRLLCFLVDLYVDHPHRRQGIAQAMIAHLVAYGCSQNWLRIYWNADRSNGRAQALYNRIARLSPYLSYYLDM
ncbi:GNAT family N-acetyltransferase [Mesorhizobium sp. M0843]|uniref:GNAT family N-acetyltransferase n=1 Tax=Mesorhizobium sp. M0843 TaxID=2957010 RepID=UPI003336E44E